MSRDSEDYVILCDPSKNLSPEQREALIECAKKAFRDLFEEEK